MSDNYAVRFISHHGILGQKHGRRRYQNPDGSLTPAGRIRYGKGKVRKSVTKSGKPVVTFRPTSDDKRLPLKDDPNYPIGRPVVLGLDGRPTPLPGWSQNNGRWTRKKSLADMSDDELKAEIARFKLEKEYNDLLKEKNPPKEKKARKIISEIAESSVKNIGTQAVTYAMGAAINKVCRGVFNVDYDIVNPKKGQKDK